MLEILSHPDAWVALASLAALEIVLGIDNIVFIAILTAKLPQHQQKLAYRLGLGGALVTRILLLLTINWVMHLTEPIGWTEAIYPLSGRDMILLGGGLFLIGKSSTEIYEKVEGAHEDAVSSWARGLVGTIVQIMILDIVFSLDSVITAVGMVEEVEIMVIAIIIAVLVMLIFARPVGEFVNRHPSMKILALSFLMLIGVLLVAQGLGQKLDKRYIYFAMSFALIIELLNMRFRRKNPDAEL